MTGHPTKRVKFRADIWPVQPDLPSRLMTFTSFWPLLQNKMTSNSFRSVFCRQVLVVRSPIISDVGGICDLKTLSVVNLGCWSLKQGLGRPHIPLHKRNTQATFHLGLLGRWRIHTLHILKLNRLCVCVQRGCVGWSNLPPSAAAAFSTRGVHRSRMV